MADKSNTSIPAPWELHIDLEGFLNIHHPSEDGRTGDLVATVFQDEAHANLVKAAPAMMAALIEAKREMWLIARDQWTMADFKNWAVIQQIDAALDLARLPPTPRPTAAHDEGG